MNGNIKSLVDLAELVEHHDKVKEDYLVNSHKLDMEDDNFLSIHGIGKYRLTDVAHSQISNKLGIPKKYYDRMSEVEGLRSYNVNSWFETMNERKLVRTLEGNARAFLSDRFKPIDNYMILSAFLTAVRGSGLQVKSTSITEQKMYVQVVFPEINGEVVKDDVVQAGIILTNSEVGMGTVDVSSVVWRLVCENGMIGESVLNKRHIGRKIGENIEDYNIYQEDTIKADMESFKLQFRDIIKYAVSEAYFQNQLAKMRKSAEDKIANVSGTIVNVTQRFGLPESDQPKIINNMMSESGMPTRWKLANSITALAHQIENPDSQYTYETVGHDLVNISQSEWTTLNESVEKRPSYKDIPSDEDLYGE